MRTSVPRLTVIDGKKFLPDGSRACSVGICARPAVVTPRRIQSYCRVHASEATRAWRQGKVSAMLTPEERDLIIELRQLQPTGRHHAGLSQMRMLAAAVAKGVAIGVLSYPLGVMVNVMIR